MISGIVASAVALVSGAVMYFAVTVHPFEDEFTIRTVGIILMIVGAVGVVLSVLLLLVVDGVRRRRASSDDRSVTTPSYDATP
jgi:preprotein translocase subunit Sss1